MAGGTAVSEGVLILRQMMVGGSFFRLKFPRYLYAAGCVQASSFGQAPVMGPVADAHGLPTNVWGAIEPNSQPQTQKQPPIVAQKS